MDFLILFLILCADEAVAHGAAVQACVLGGCDEAEDILITDIASLSLGIETAGGMPFSLSLSLSLDFFPLSLSASLLLYLSLSTN
jgi:hypothetical protein